MSNAIPRRSFLSFAAGTLFVSPSFLQRVRTQEEVPLVDQVPSLLDHILLGCNDLQHGIDFVEKQTGVRAAFGGVHPGRGTQNALLSLGERRYLEIIAPDPKQQTPDVAPMISKSAAQLLSHLQSLKSPQLVGWAAHPPDLDALAKKLAANGYTFDGPRPGSRARPDGRVLHWRTLNLANDQDGLLPFFIQWSADSVHPSEDAPKGCRLLGFEAITPTPEKLAKTAASLGMDLPCVKGEKAGLQATVMGPKGRVVLTS